MKKGLLYAAIASIFLGVGAAIASEAGKVMNPFLFAGFVPLLSVPLFFVIAVLRKERVRVKECFRKFRRETIGLIITRSWLGNYLVLFGLALTLAIRGGFLLRFEPVFVALFGFFIFHKSLGRRAAVLIAAVLFGSVLLISEGNLSILTSSYSYGDIIIIIGTIFYAYSYHPSKRISEGLNATTAAIVTNTASAAILPLFLLLFWKDLPTVIANFHYVIFQAVVSFTLGFYFWFLAFETAEAWEVATVISLSAVVTAITANLWLGDTLSTIQLLGAGIIMGASYLISVKN